jgi:2-methylisocitrate lyase-like PEP mutase family enzyme
VNGAANTFRYAMGDCGVAAFLNARTDTHLFRDPAASDEDLLTEAIDPGHAYIGAGADGLFVPRFADHAAIAAICAAANAPVNLMLGTEQADVDTLYSLGVRRLTRGPHFHILAQQRLQDDIATSSAASGEHDPAQETRRLIPHRHQETVGTGATRRRPAPSCTWPDRGPRATRRHCCGVPFPAPHS